MPYRRPNTQNWWISYYDPQTGKQVRKPAGTDYKAAKALEQQHRAQAHQDKARAAHDSPLDTLLARYLETRLTPRTRATARHLLPLAGLWYSELTPAHIRAHIRHRQDQGAAPATINKELTLLSAALNAHALDHNLPRNNPVSGLKCREPQGKLRWLTQTEYQRLLDHSTGYLRDLIILACHTGLRKTELTQLRWERIDFTHHRLTLEPHETKSGKRRSIPLNAHALDALRRRAQEATDAHVFPVADFKKAFATACRRANLPDVTPHTLRHTFASWLVINGVPLVEVRDLLGHSTIKLTERYAHLAPENLRTAVDALCAQSVIASEHTPDKTTA
jgi:integrase